MKKNKKKYYEGMGLVEALVAIAVAGIACIVFLQLAATSMLNVSRTETYDQMASSASETSVMLKRIADKQNLLAVGSSPRLFPEPALASTGNCYIVEGDLKDPYFRKTGTGTIQTICNYSSISSCKSSFTDKKLFTVYCMQSSQQIDSEYYLVKGVIVSGIVSCLGSDSSCLLKNYSLVTLDKVKR